MSRRCELTGKTAQVGHRVSHSNIKTKRRFLPNLLNVTMISDALGRSVKLRISANALKTVDHRGGLDAFLMQAKDDELSERALDLKRQIRRRVSLQVDVVAGTNLFRVLHVIRFVRLQSFSPSAAPPCRRAEARDSNIRLE